MNKVAKKFIVLLLFVPYLSPKEASACSCDYASLQEILDLNLEEVSNKQQVNEYLWYPSLFVGDVIETVKLELHIVAKIKVIKSWYGLEQDVDTLNIIVNGSGGPACGINVEPRRKYFFHTIRTTLFDGSKMQYASLCSHTEELEDQEEAEDVYPILSNYKSRLHSIDPPLYVLDERAEDAKLTFFNGVILRIGKRMPNSFVFLFIIYLLALFWKKRIFFKAITYAFFLFLPINYFDIAPIFLLVLPLPVVLLGLYHKEKFLAHKFLNYLFIALIFSLGAFFIFFIQESISFYIDVIDQEKPFLIDFYMGDSLRNSLSFAFMIIGSAVLAVISALLVMAKDELVAKWKKKRNK